MPSKSTSPEAAQRKVWKAEIRDHEKARHKVRADFRNEQKQLIKKSLAAHKLHETAHKAVLKFQARAEKELPKQEAEIDKRIAILKGRLGL